MPAGRALTLVDVQAGICVRQLTEELDNRGLALANMGGYDGQTLSGTLSAGTHGSGVGFGPLASFVRAVVLVCESGAVYRIEPAAGHRPGHLCRRRRRRPGRAKSGRRVVPRCGCGHRLHGPGLLVPAGGSAGLLGVRAAHNHHLGRRARRPSSRALAAGGAARDRIRPL